MKQVRKERPSAHDLNISAVGLVSNLRREHVLHGQRSLLFRPAPCNLGRDGNGKVKIISTQRHSFRELAGRGFNNEREKDLPGRMREKGSKLAFL